MKLYIAAAAANTYIEKVVTLLESEGHKIYVWYEPYKNDKGDLGETYDANFDWTQADPLWRDWEPDEFIASGLSHPGALKAFQTSEEAMEWADGCVLVLPSGLDAHMEAAHMAGTGKPVYVLMMELEKAQLMYLLLYRLCTTPEALVEALNNTKRRIQPKPPPFLVSLHRPDRLPKRTTPLTFEPMSSQSTEPEDEDWDEETHESGKHLEQPDEEDDDEVEETDGPIGDLADE